ncbi:MAG: DUF1566 domain-containing protein [Candidatus Electrothrix sp. GW3-4]|uniref:Lcl C-terminal domain-containing protein n=1 Tax=Candidatus Electrothrix sp. GW3-4 TaxID=3126740 RepID=UPI0030CC247E
MKKQYLVILTLAGLFIAGSGFFRSVYSYKLLLMMPPILAGAMRGWQPLNDTGITWGGNYPSGNNADCTGEEIDAQDCSHGRDTTRNDDTDGHAGFSFTKLDSNGDPLVDQGATSWSCVQDKVTGLIWEIKTDDGGLHDKDDTYTWYSSASSLGSADGGGATCFGYDSNDSGTFCNTETYVERVNATNLCGASDWRMPTIKELKSLVHYGRVNPAIDVAYFPNLVAVSFLFWSDSLNASNLNQAWLLHFYYGLSDVDSTSYSYEVRLVRRAN